MGGGRYAKAVATPYACTISTFPPTFFLYFTKNTNGRQAKVIPMDRVCHPTFGIMVLIVKKNTTRAKLRALLKTSQRHKAKGFDAKRFNGALPLKGDPLKVQRKLRDEWG